MFSYSVMLTCAIDGRLFEFHKEWKTEVQLRKGDSVHINGLEEVEVDYVTWYVDRPREAFMLLVDRDCGGKPSDWQCVLDTMDCCIPDLASESTG